MDDRWLSVEEIATHLGVKRDTVYKWRIRQLEPKAARVTLPSATIKDEKELEEWTEAAIAAIKEKLQEGPVIV